LAKKVYDAHAGESVALRTVLLLPMM